MPGLNAFDAGVLTFVQEHCHNAVTDAVFPVITYLGEAGVFWLLLMGALLFFKRTRLCGITGLCAVAAGFLLGEILLKNLVCRPRPFTVFPEMGTLLIPPPSGFSFPSGHTCASFAAATAVCLRFRKWGIAALCLAGLIGFSRIFLFVHYPTDVLAGAALGVLCALLAHWAAQKIQKRPPPNENPE